LTIYYSSYLPADAVETHRFHNLEHAKQHEGVDYSPLKMYD
jgi:hypothetical protein